VKRTRSRHRMAALGRLLGCMLSIACSTTEPPIITCAAAEATAEQTSDAAGWGGGTDLEEGRKHWAFQPLKASAVPDVARQDWARSDIDRYVLRALEGHGLQPVGDSDRATLLRRLSFDLIGLPPSPEDVEAFVADTSGDAAERVVDRLLASPRFGEKWGRHWLDVARYAESTGKTVNFYYPHAWRYRDYVIAAFNADKPFDQFIREQLAGDLLESTTAAEEAERTIATGFLAIGPKALNERSGLKYELDMADEQIDVTTQAFLGVTVACARCHDHKFDPIPMADYYAMAGIFRSTETLYGTVRYINAQRPGGAIPLPDGVGLPAGRGPMSRREQVFLDRQIRSVQQSLPTLNDPLQRFFTTGRLSLLEARLDGFEDDGSPKLLAMGVRDKPPGPEPVRRFPGRRFGGQGGFTYDGSRTVGDSPVFERGESDEPTQETVPRGGLQVLTPERFELSEAASGRLELADWIASESNPLTARVVVNRVWLQLFGRGLVPTADDFGHAGRPPSHPELLDRLALDFIEDGWSIKRLIRSLVLTRTYQLASTADPHAILVDPENVWLWRMQPRRLDAEAVRDAMLAVSGRLDEQPPAGSVVAAAGEGPVSRPFQPRDPVLAAVNDPTNTHRSVYLPALRDNLPEVMAVFDAADPSLITPQRQQTTVPSQALFLLNNRFVELAADAMADRLLPESDTNERIRRAFLLAYGRLPTEAEQAATRAFAEGYAADLPEDLDTDDRQADTWSAVCQALFASAEFQYRR